MSETIDSLTGEVSQKILLTLLMKHERLTEFRQEILLTKFSLISLNYTATVS
ncbi:hypothetical protein ACGO3R_00375 [Lactococcus lactis]